MAHGTFGDTEEACIDNNFKSDINTECATEEDLDEIGVGIAGFWDEMRSN